VPYNILVHVAAELAAEHKLLPVNVDCKAVTGEAATNPTAEFMSNSKREQGDLRFSVSHTTPTTRRGIYDTALSASSADANTRPNVSHI
jgi:hypothetical protein